jgi:hypothetical protein
METNRLVAKTGAAANYLFLRARHLLCASHPLILLDYEMFGRNIFALPVFPRQF